MGGARPLTINDLVEITGVRDIRRVQYCSSMSALTVVDVVPYLGLLVPRPRPVGSLASGAILRFRCLAEKPFAFNY
jgi:hypothetical protein